MTASLAGLNVLITRPQGRVGELRAALEQAGARVRHLPLLVLQPLHGQHDAELLHRNRRLSQGLDRYRKVIFVSVTAVEYGLDALAQEWPRWPSGPLYYGVGAATARALCQRGIDARQPGGDMNSEALLALPEWQRVAGESVLIVRGVGGRDHLAAELTRRGAHVDLLECYRRGPPAASAAELYAQAQWAHAIGLNSGETLDRFRRLWEAGGGAPQNLQAVLVVPGQRVAGLAREAGFRHCLVAGNAGTSATLAALERWWMHGGESPGTG